MSPADRDHQIASMLRRDIAVGVTLAALMWVTLLFVYLVTIQAVPDRLVSVVMGCAMALLGIFNTLSLLSLIRRYRAEREAIYTDDLYFLDLARAERAHRRQA